MSWVPGCRGCDPRVSATVHCSRRTGRARRALTGDHHRDAITDVVRLPASRTFTGTITRSRERSDRDRGRAGIGAALRQDRQHDVVGRPAWCRRTRFSASRSASAQSKRRWGPISMLSESATGGSPCPGIGERGGHFARSAERFQVASAAEAIAFTDDHAMPDLGPTAQRRGRRTLSSAAADRRASRRRNQPERGRSSLDDCRRGSATGPW